MTTLVVNTQHGPLILEREAIQGGMRLVDGRTLLLLSGRQIRTTTPIEEIWPGVEVGVAASAPPSARDAEAAGAVASAVKARAERDAEAELAKARAERARLALEEGRSAARAAQAAALERAALEQAAEVAPSAPEQARPKTAKAAKAKPAKARKARR